MGEEWMEMRNAYTVFVCTLKRKRSHWRSRRGWPNNIKTDLIWIGWKYMGSDRIESGGELFIYLFICLCLYFYIFVAYLATLPVAQILMLRTESKSRNTEYKRCGRKRP
jgi:hypothetical protein